MEALKKYADELGVMSLTLESLIASHRSLRTMAMQTNEERRAEMQRARDIATQQANERVMHGEYISVEKLRTMTIKEITELICEE